MRSLVRDWRRWSKAERAVAILVIASSFVAIPLSIVMNVH